MTDATIRLLCRLFGQGHQLSVTPGSSLHCDPPSVSVSPEIVDALRSAKPEIIRELSRCWAGHPYPLGWVVIDVLFDQAFAVREAAQHGTDIHKAAAEACTLIQRYDDAIAEGFEQAQAWAKENGWRIRELADVTAGIRKYEPIIEGSALIQAAQEVFGLNAKQEAA